jgi:hypothetical protein
MRMVSSGETQSETTARIPGNHAPLAEAHPPLDGTAQGNPSTFKSQTVCSTTTSQSGINEHSPLLEMPSRYVHLHPLDSPTRAASTDSADQRNCTMDLSFDLLGEDSDEYHSPEEDILGASMKRESATSLSEATRSVNVDLAPPTPSTLRAQQSRRRQSNRRRRRTSETLVGPSSSALPASPSNAALRRPQTSRGSTAATMSLQQANSHPNENASAQVGILASLDAGMVAVRRWIRSRPERSLSEASGSVPRISFRGEDTSSRTVSWQQGVTSDGTSVEEFNGDVGGNEESFNFFSMYSRSSTFSQPTIVEEAESDEEEHGRQRAFSEPDVSGVRFFAFQRNSNSRQRQVRQRRGSRRRAESESSSIPNSPRVQLSSSAAAALNTSTDLSSQRSSSNQSVNHMVSLDTDGPDWPSRPRSFTDGGIELSTVRTLEEPAGDPIQHDSSNSPMSTHSELANDSDRRARVRWIQINRRFQFVITFVALIFSLLLFSILICWVVLTSSYVVSIDKTCDVPLKAYFWLVTLQLVLDVFRTDIMRFVFHWDSNSNQRIPCRVILYNIAYLTYALLVLRLGVLSVYVDETSCNRTAPELFNSSTAFVSLSIAAWGTIVCGYLLPFCVVAAMLTCNGYNPSSSQRPDDHGASHPVFPAAYSSTGAPPGCVDRLKAIRMDDYPGGFPGECCICMENFDYHDEVVETACKHVFHKSCCRQWLRQARTCPVCRSDIPSTLEGFTEETESTNGHNSTPRIPLGPTGRPVVGLIRMLTPISEPGTATRPPQHDPGSARNASSGHSAGYTTNSDSQRSDVEEGRSRSLYTS